MPNDADAELFVPNCPAPLTAADREILPALALGLPGRELTSLLRVRTQIKSIKSMLGTHMLAQSVVSVMACRREGCPERERVARCDAPRRCWATNANAFAQTSQARGTVARHSNCNEVAGSNQWRLGTATSGGYVP